MPSPVGHTLAGLCGFILASPPIKKAHRLYLLAGTVVISNAPDLDALSGLILAGDPRKYHRLASHSITAAAIAGFLTFLIVKQTKLTRPSHWGLWAFILYASHIILDMFVTDTRAPYGVQLLWPFSEQSFIAPFTPFGGFDYFSPGVSMISTVFSLHNLQVALKEAVFIAPVLCLVTVLMSTQKSTKHYKDY